MSERVGRIKNRVVLHPDRLENTASMEMYGGADGSAPWTLEAFKENFRVNVISATADTMEFDMIGIDAAIANTIRRVLIAEVPTMAFEDVFIHNNTSILPDEVLAHRLGMIPLRADPRIFNFRQCVGVVSEIFRANKADARSLDENGVSESDVDTASTLVFELDVKCSVNPAAPRGTTDPDKLYTHTCVMSTDIKWKSPLDSVETVGADGADGAELGPVHDNILIAKLRPGQCIHAVLHAVKGIGKEHAKWSPVGTASYRLMPAIVLKDVIEADDAFLLQKCFPEGVIAVTPNEDGVPVAVVANPRACSMTREVHRHPQLVDRVELQRIKDHFIFSVESTGAMQPAELVVEACVTISEKCDAILKILASGGIGVSK